MAVLDMDEARGRPERDSVRDGGTWLEGVGGQLGASTDHQLPLRPLLNRQVYHVTTLAGSLLCSTWQPAAHVDRCRVGGEKLRGHLFGRGPLSGRSRRSIG